MEIEDSKKKFYKEFNKIFKNDAKLNRFEDTRRCLLKIYQSNIQTHAGYIIAIIIGSLAFVSQYNIFLSVPQQEPYIILGKIAYFGIIGIITSSSIYIIKRMLYWNTFSSAIINCTIKDLGDNYIRYVLCLKKPVIKADTPYSSIIEAGSSKHLEDLKTEEDIARTTKFAIKKNSNVFISACLIGLDIFIILLTISLSIP